MASKRKTKGLERFDRHPAWLRGMFATDQIKHMGNGWELYKASIPQSDEIRKAQAYNREVITDYRV